MLLVTLSKDAVHATKSVVRYFCLSSGTANRPQPASIVEPWGGDVAQLVEASDRHAADAGSIPRCGKGFFSQSQLSVQTLLRVSLHPRVQSHALTAVHTLKIL